MVCGETRGVMSELQKEDRDNCLVILTVLLFFLFFSTSKAFPVIRCHHFCVFLLLLLLFNSIKSSTNSHLKWFKYETF
jgi:hypothetical protein